ncbi:homologous-pairing protein 2 homolog [Amphiura filiformis]|uniref:homologous-pairing protein 2 homolog n=1 Tax=Amphiura filiformis TaxID=82378 RepID=UPI003B212CBB
MSKGKDANAASAVLDYLNKQNRPYSAIDIFNNLHKEYGKTAVVRVLEELGKEGKITEKVYGKQKVYVADQSQFPDVADSELKSMDVRIKELNDKLVTSRTTCKTQERELHMLNSALTTEEAKKRLEDVTTQCEQKQKRIDKIQSATNHVSPEEKDRIYTNQKTFVKEWRKRKRMATDVVNAILEGYPKTKKQLFEDIGLETDEEYSAVIPSC